MRTWAALIVALTLAGSYATAWAQGGDNPPEILTSDLALKTLLESNRVQADFVIVDDDTVVEVTINGEKQTFDPADTVLLSKEFVFGSEPSKVVVTAKDQAGNTKTVTYAIFPPGVDPDRQPKKAPKRKLTWFVAYDARYENDDNPTQDLSSPIAIEGIELTGVVPDDEQADTRTNLLAMGGIKYGPWTGFLGISRISYSKADIASNYDVAVNFLGGGYSRAIGGWEAGYVFADINLGTSDYALTHTVSPGYRMFSDEGEDGQGNTLFALDLTQKQFANTKIQEDTTLFQFRWDYKETDPAKQDTYTRRIHLGTASEGIEDTEYTYLSLDWDWANRWDSGLLFDIGLGTAYRDFKTDEPLSKDTFLGETRVDSPLRFSTGIGWQFSPKVRLMGNYNYTFNMSNKTPYVRQVYGVSVNGTF